MDECEQSLGGHVLKPSCMCNNLLQNPSFETGLTGWETNNVIVADGNPFGGTQVARLGAGVASMFQDVSLAKTVDPLFLSFNAFAGSDSESNGNLIAKVLWLDGHRNTIATGLMSFIPNGRIEPDVWITFFDITDQSPGGAVFARLQFSKGAGAAVDTIDIDQVILAPVNTINLVQNPGFELGLTGWTTTTFVQAADPFEGAANVLTISDGALSQDVYIKDLPANSSFLLSFAAIAQGEIVSLAIQVQWLSAAGEQIGAPGLDLVIPSLTLGAQTNYLTYLDITNPAPTGTVTARILFNANIIEKLSFIQIDQVILAKTSTPNLVQNPSFKNGLDNWNAFNTTVTASNRAYEGGQVARLAAGGVLFQEIPIAPASGQCFLFSFGYSAVGVAPGNLLARVNWLDKNNRVIGLGLGLAVPSNTAIPGAWLVYTGITEPTPRGTAKARVQFTKSAGSVEMDIDKVVFGRLI